MPYENNVNDKKVEVAQRSDRYASTIYRSIGSVVLLELQHFSSFKLLAKNLNIKKLLVVSRIRLINLSETYCLKI